MKNQITNKKLGNYERDDQGRWKAKIRFEHVALGILFGGIFIAYCFHSANAGSGASESSAVESVAVTSTVDANGLLTEPGCLRIGDSYWQCGDREAVAKWKEYLEIEIKKLEAKIPQKITAIQTRYSRKDSCHFPKWVNGKKLCLTAIGKDTKEGRTVACPRNIKLGTKILIEGKEYVCEDRYSTYLDAKRGLPTFDVFAEAENLNKLPAFKQVEVAILK